MKKRLFILFMFACLVITCSIMADDDKTVVDEPAEEPVVDEEPEADAKPAEEPVPPAGGAPAPSDGATPAGTDQQGRQLYNVKCSDCGKETQVPFKPSGDRPVYCRDCYMKRRGGEGMGRGPRR